VCVCVRVCVFVVLGRVSRAGELTPSSLLKTAGTSGPRAARAAPVSVAASINRSGSSEAASKRASHRISRPSASVLPFSTWRALGREGERGCAVGCVGVSVDQKIRVFGGRVEESVAQDQPPLCVRVALLHLAAIIREGGRERV
jgi:hypothetical protein